jgi:hypothetical protein
MDILEKLIAAKDFHTHYEEAANEILKLRQQLTKPTDAVIKAARKTLEENSHLADGDVCTLFELREAIAAYDAKPADDTITVSKAEWEVVRSAMFKLAAQMAMKQNMPEVEHVNYSVNIPKKSWRSIQKMCSKSTQQCNDWSYELRQAIDKVSAAIQGESK